MDWLWMIASIVTAFVVGALTDRLMMEGRIAESDAQIAKLEAMLDDLEGVK